MKQSLSLRRKLLDRSRNRLHKRSGSQRCRIRLYNRSRSRSKRRYRSGSSSGRDYVSIAKSVLYDLSQHHHTYKQDTQKFLNSLTLTKMLHLFNARDHNEIPEVCGRVYLYAMYKKMEVLEMVQDILMKWIDLRFAPTILEQTNRVNHLETDLKALHRSIEIQTRKINAKNHEVSNLDAELKSKRAELQQFNDEHASHIAIELSRLRAEMERRCIAFEDEEEEELMDVDST